MKVGEEIGRLADALSVSPETITEAMEDCEMDCTEHAGARESLRQKLDFVLDGLARKSRRVAALEARK